MKELISKISDFAAVISTDNIVMTGKIIIYIRAEMGKEL